VNEKLKGGSKAYLIGNVMKYYVSAMLA